MFKLIKLFLALSLISSSHNNRAACTTSTPVLTIQDSTDAKQIENYLKDKFGELYHESLIKIYIHLLKFEPASRTKILIALIEKVRKIRPSNLDQVMAQRGLLALYVSEGALEEHVNSLLYDSALQNDYVMSEFLLKHGANPNAKMEPLYKTALFEARSTKMVLLLMSRGAAHCVPGIEESLSHQVMFPAYEAELITLYGHLIDISNTKNFLNESPLHELAYKAENYDNETLLIKKITILKQLGINIKAQGLGGETAEDIARMKIKTLSQLTKTHEIERRIKMCEIFIAQISGSESNTVLISPIHEESKTA
jgi:hypothetical protein